MIQGLGFTAQFKWQKKYKTGDTLVDLSCRFGAISILRTLQANYIGSTSFIMEGAKYFINPNYLNL